MKKNKKKVVDEVAEENCPNTYSLFDSSYTGLPTALIDRI